MTTTYGHVERKARTAKSCWWCGEKINAGEQYHRWVSVEDGMKTSIEVHPECKKAWGRYKGCYECNPGEHIRGTMEAR